VRQELLAKLVDPDHAEAAAAELRSHPEWLRGGPPPARPSTPGVSPP